MNRRQPRAYVYSIAAVRARLRRGHRSILLFMPYSGRLVRVTRRNLASVSAAFRRADGGVQ